MGECVPCEVVEEGTIHCHPFHLSLAGEGEQPHLCTPLAKVEGQLLVGQHEGTMTRRRRIRSTRTRTMTANWSRRRGQWVQLYFGHDHPSRVTVCIEIGTAIKITSITTHMYSGLIGVWHMLCWLQGSLCVSQTPKPHLRYHRLTRVPRHCPELLCTP